VGAGIVAWDLLAPETLSSAFRRGAENERTRPYVLAALGVTALHLLGALPRQVDPFALAFECIKPEL
jgi:hypothetical protein